MTHQECQERLLDFAYGELGPRERSDVAAHLAACPACAGVYRRIAGVREVMGQLEPEAPPGQGERLILAAAREVAEHRRDRRSPLGLPLWMWKASVATAVVAAVAGVSVKIATVREQATPEETFAKSPPGPALEAPAAETGSAVAEAAPAPPQRTAVPAEAKAVRSPAAAPGRGSLERRRAPAAVAAADAAKREEPAPAKQPEVAVGPAASGRATGGPAESGLLASEVARPEPEAAPLRAARPEVAGAEPPSPSEPRRALSARANARGPALGAARGVVQDIERRLGSGRLVESTRPFQACGPAEDAERRLYAGPDGRVVKYVRQSGSAEAALTFEQYYDAEGRLRHVLIHGGAVNGAVLEHRIWLDAEGNRLLEEQRFRRGRYPFPETWPDAELSLRAPDSSALRCGAP